MSSLANQLQSIASLDASRLTSRTGAPSSKSYLFPPKIAADHDLDSIFALAQSGYEELLSLDLAFGDFEDELFSEQAKRTDRTLLNSAENANLDEVLGRCLRRLGRWVGVMAGGKCLEWLVRRFRVHEMNADTVFEVFLPYHQSPNFARMLAILTISKESPYYVPFHPLIKNAQSIPRSYITNAISPSRDKSLRLLGNVSGMLKSSMEEGVVHRPLLAFWTGIHVDLLQSYSSGQKPSEGLVKLFVESFITVLQTKNGGSDANAAVYPPLVLLTRIVRLSDGPFLAVLEAIITSKSGADSSQRLLTLLVLLQARTGWQGGLGSQAAEKLARIKQLSEILIAAVQKYGFEEALKVILPVLGQRSDIFETHLKIITDTIDLSSTIVESLAEALITRPNGKASAVLDQLKQRYPAAVDAVFVRHPELASSSSEKTDQMVNGFAADIATRAQAVDSILTGQSDIDAGAQKEMLLTRLRDDEVEVLQAIYQHPDALLKIVGNLEDYFPVVEQIFSRTQVEKAVLLEHLQFACNQVAKTAKWRSSIFEKMLWPCLLSTSQNSGLGQDGWQMVFQSPMGKYALIACVDQTLLVGQASPQTLIAISQAIAGAIEHSKESQHHLTFLLSQSASGHIASKLFAQTVLNNILRAKGDVTLAARLLDQLQHARIRGKMSDLGESTDSLSPLMLKSICEKPNDHITGQRTVIALLASFSGVQRPAGNVISLNGSENEYQSFAHQLYDLANSDILPTPLAQHLLRSLLAQLKDEALAFFAFKWTRLSGNRAVTPLKHAAAFVNAYLSSPEQTVDLQLIIPALLIALQNKVKEARLWAIQILKGISKLLERDPNNIYGLDTIYGSRSDVVKLLKTSDLKRYLNDILLVKDEIIVDPSRLTTLHIAKLGAKSTHRKDTSHRRAVIGALMSHVVAWRDLSPRLSLLRTLSSVHDSTLFRGVLPLLSIAEEEKWLQALSEPTRSECLKIIFSMLNTRIASKMVGSADDEAWTFLTSLLPARDGLKLQMRTLMLDSMTEGVFEALQPTLKSNFACLLLESLHDQSSDTVIASTAILSRLTMEPSVLVETIHELVQPLEATSQRKRQKQDTSAANSKGENAVSSLTVLLESRDWSKILPDPALIGSLMDVLSALLAKRQHIKDGVDYLEQEVLGAILALIERLQDSTELQKSHLGLEVIIKVIRASSNPRTSQRALLVVSELARLMPEAVLHNVMPIFTFMGASDFQRDDAYSFSVVEKTVSRIVPVLTASLKSKGLSRLNLYKESLTILSIFTDMAGRLPKHRTLPFFIHLVKSLDQAYFLAPVCMLLVDRTTTKGGRGGTSSSQAMELPITLASSFSVDDRLITIVESLREVDRLLSTAPEAFLGSLNQDESPERTERRTKAVLAFSASITKSLQGKSCDQAMIEQMVELLLSLSGSSNNLATSVGPVLTAAVHLLSADSFFKVVSGSIQSPDINTNVTACQILVERLPKVKAEIRTKNATLMGDIIRKSAELLSTSASTVSLAALQAVASTAISSENDALAQVVPVMIKAANSATESKQILGLLSLLETLVKYLAQRIIPQLNGIVALCLQSSQSTSTSVWRQSISLLSTVINTVPTFISSKQLYSALSSVLAQSGRDAEISRGFMSSLSKKIATKTLFGVITDLYRSIDHQHLNSFFDLLRLTLKNSNRQDIGGMTKTLFAFFLQIFDLPYTLTKRGGDDQVIESVEASAVESFLEWVTKLNEATFKPFFVRLYDWAVIDLEGQDEDHLNLRKIVLMQVMLGLLQKFKNLLSPYISTLLPSFEEILPAYATGQATNPRLWTVTLEVLSKSFEVDEGAFWTDALLLKMIPLLVPQLSTTLNLTMDAQTSQYPDVVNDSLSSLAGATESEPVLKALNTSVCMVTRDDDVQIRMAALRALEEIWEEAGEEMSGLVPETVGEFLTELLDDENSEVLGMTRQLLGKIENVGGDLEEYL